MKTKLKRSLTLPLLTFYGLGNILGAGIYVLVGKVAGSAGIYAPLSFLLASVIAGVTAFTYAELSARIPLSAGEAVYIQHAFGRRALSTTVGLLVALAGMVSAAAISRGFAGYLNVFFSVPDAVAITLLVIGLGLLAAWGISQSVKIAALLTLVEIGGLLLVIAVAGDQFATLPQRLPELVPTADGFVWQGIFMGAFLAFYAYIGFEDMVNVAEEVERPQRNLPLAILLALLISSVLYLLVAVVAVLAVEPAQLAASDAPLALIYTTATGREPVLITQVALFAVVNGALIQIIMASRVFYGMSAQGWLSPHLSQIHGKTQTPLIATALVILTVLVMALWLPLVTLAKITSAIVLVVFVSVNLALLIIKRRDPHPQQVRVYPVWVPLIGLLSAVALILFEVLF